VATHQAVVFGSLGLHVLLVRPEALDGEQVVAGELAVQPLGQRQDAGVVGAARDLEDPIVVAVWKYAREPMLTI
jgi:hypothetical protein